MIKKFKKKPCEVEAMKWDGEDHRGMFDFLTNNKCKDEHMFIDGDNFYIDHSKVARGLMIKTLEGEHKASVGDWVIKGIKGEFYPCKPDIFDESYEEVGNK